MIARRREADHGKSGEVAGPAEWPDQPIADRRDRAGDQRRDGEGLRGGEGERASLRSRDHEHERDDDRAEDERPGHVRSPTAGRADDRGREERTRRERQRDEPRPGRRIELLRGDKSQGHGDRIWRDDEHEIPEPPQSKRCEERRARAMRGEIEERGDRGRARRRAAPGAPARARRSARALAPCCRGPGS